MSSYITLNQNMDNEFILTIKKNHTLLPVVIYETDTFEMQIIKMEDNSVVSTIEMAESDDGQITVYDEDNGQLMVLLKESFINSLEIERGEKADRYYEKPMYKIALKANTVDNGNFILKINNIRIA